MQHAANVGSGHRKQQVPADDVPAVCIEDCYEKVPPIINPQVHDVAVPLLVRLGRREGCRVRQGVALTAAISSMSGLRREKIV